MNFDDTLELFLSLHPHVSNNQPKQVEFLFRSWYYHLDKSKPLEKVTRESSKGTKGTQIDLFV